MRNIVKLNMLLRVRVELPIGLRVATEEFREGWNFARTVDAERLKRRIQTRGWSFIKVAEVSVRSGIGNTSQEAIASALKLALRRISEHFNAVEVENIVLTRYPWFYLAKVRVYPYRIQREADEPVPDGVQFPSAAPRDREAAAQAAGVFAEFGSAMPPLEQKLISSRGSEARPQ